ncbi:MAG: hypothetical protein E7K72_00810 [Roseomonas mucosa]|nr:hypothetical protein [Roseomonas mucosa]
MIPSLFVLTLAAAPVAAEGAMDRCQGSQAAMMACVDREADRARARLAGAHRALLAALAAWDEEPRHAATARRAAGTARTAYDADRSARCALHQALVGGGAGNSRRTALRACEADMDDAYADLLEAAAARLPRR